MEAKESIPPIEVVEKMSRQERQKYLDGRLRDLVSHAYEKAPAIKERLDKAGIAPSAV